MELSALKEKVRLKVNELVPDASVKLSLSGLVNPTDTYIEDALNDSVRSLMTDVPSYRINGKDAKVDGAYDFSIGGDFVVTVTLPEDAIKLQKAKMVGWLRSVTENITPLDEAYKLQQNAYTRGRIAKPAVSLENSRTMKLYSAKSAEDTIEELTFIHACAPTEVQDNLIEVYVLRAAASYLTNRKEEGAEVIWKVYESKIKELV